MDVNQRRQWLCDNSGAEAAVASLLKTWERTIQKRWGTKRYLFNRKAGVAKNKNYKHWFVLLCRLRERGFDVTGYLDWFSYAWAKQSERRKQEKIPFVSRMAHPSYLDRYADIRVKWAKRESLMLLEIEDGAEILAYLLEGTGGTDRAAEAIGVIASTWSAFPATWLAMSQTFWDHARADLIVASVAPDHLRLARQIHQQLKREPAKAKKLAAAFEESMLSVL